MTTFFLGRKYRWALKAFIWAMKLVIRFLKWLLKRKKR